MTRFGFCMTTPNRGGKRGWRGGNELRSASRRRQTPLKGINALQRRPAADFIVGLLTDDCEGRSRQGRRPHPAPERGGARHNAD